jgi:hypothetical protein
MNPSRGFVQDINAARREQTYARGYVRAVFGYRDCREEASRRHAR